MKRSCLFALAAALLFALDTPPAFADGTETLGQPSVPVASGTGVAVAGVGLFSQPASFSIEIPGDATVRQALLYYEAGHRTGDASGNAPDQSVVVNGTTVVASRIGGPTEFYGDVLTATHRADVTALALVGPGTNTITVNGLDDDEVRDGAGLVVIYDQPNRQVQLSLVDGNDVAFANFAAPRNAAVPQTFSFDAATVERTATLALLTTSLHDPIPAGIPNPSGNPRNRPNFVDLTIGGTTTRLADPLGDAAPEWDAGLLNVSIPAGATSLTVRYVSEYDQSGDLPASVVWLGAALVVPLAQPPATTTTTTTVPPPTTTAPTTTTTAPTTTTTAPRVLPRTLAATGIGLAALAAVAAGLVAIGVAFRARAKTGPQR